MRDCLNFRPCRPASALEHADDSAHRATTGCKQALASAGNVAEQAMATQQSSGFPFATLAIVAAFISSTVLAPRAFDLLRPPEGERYQHALDKQRDIEARLWEDPFSVTYKALKARDVMGAKVKGIDPAKRGDAGGVALESLLGGTVAGMNEQDLVIIALLPGNPFVGAQEARRRTRYALIAGLGAEQLWPENPEHLGLAIASFSREPAEKDTKTSPQSAQYLLPVPYELFKRDARPSGPPKDMATKALLLWVDGSALPSPRLDSFALSLEQLTRDCVPRCPKLAVIGPSSSDDLQQALEDLAHRARAVLKQEPLAPRLRLGYQALARADIYNAAATAPPASVLPAGHERDDLQAFLRKQLALIIGPGPDPAVRYHPAVTTDDLLAEALVAELRQRGVGDAPHERVVLIAESDSFYSRELIRRFCRLAKGDDHRRAMRVEVQYYLRGLDGAITGDSGKDVDTRGRDPRDARSIEWPEARDQRDYVRRMVERLRQTEQRPETRIKVKESTGGCAADGSADTDAESEPQLMETGPITAVGVFGTDVHDKLIVLQALRDVFPDKPVFTTDLDARYLHPKAVPFARNLITASGLALRVTPTLDPSNSVMPMRDSYQTSAYFAARWAAGDSEKTRCKVAVRLAEPRVWEVGRSDFVVLSTAHSKVEDLRKRVPLAFDGCTQTTDLRNGTPAAKPALMAASALVLLALALLLVRSPLAPALQAIRDTSANSLLLCLSCDRRPIVTFFLGTYAAAFALVFCTAVELVAPGQLSIARIVALTALAPVLAWLAVFPRADRMANILLGHGTDARCHTDWLGFAVLLVLAGIAIGAASISWNVHDERTFEPLRWLEGVSAWPSHLLHLTALVVAIVYADRTWYAALDSLRQIEILLAGESFDWAAAAAQGASPAAGPRSVLQWLRDRLIITWHHGRRVDAGHAKAAAGSGSSAPDDIAFSRLWQEYRLRGAGMARLLRVLLWTLVTVALALLTAALIDRGFRLDVPARGETHRFLVSAGQIAAMLALAVLAVAVADSTTLACRFIRFLNRGRSIYPREVIERQAKAFGTENRELWCTVVPGAGVVAGNRGHTLLDDWLDVRVIAERTDVIARLIIGPFVVLAVIIVARSRLFDAWSLNLVLATIAGGFLIWMVVLATTLKMHAEKLRATALERMQADLRWLKGSGEQFKPLVDPFARLIEDVESNRKGAFAAIFEQPLVRAILVPLGGAGGVQFFDYFLLAR
jgi:hypothetical protein